MENFLDFNFSTKIPVIPLKILTTKSAMRYSMFNKSHTKKLKKLKFRIYFGHFFRKFSRHERFNRAEKV